MSEYCKNCFEFAEKLTEKEQKCEQYKKRAVYFKDVNKQLGYKYLTIKQECEELKSKNSILKKSLKPFQDEYFKNLETIVIAGLAKKSIRITAENTQLRKALEEIEEFAKENDEMLQGYHHEWANNRQILEIINKAKGEGNGN